MEQTDIQKYIDDGVEESLILDYKAADALGKSDGKKKEITKDVSAMANSAGGRIIYGVREFGDDARKHLPETINAVDRTEFSKEWLEQIINNIRPRIDGILIYSIDLNTGVNDVVYVVDIPKSNTAHQATDHRYYKRFNFLSVPMEDHEIRDVMARQQFSKFDLSFKINISTKYNRDSYDIFKHPKPSNECNLIIHANNIGGVFAQYVNCFISLPTQLVPKFTLEMYEKKGKIPEYHEIYKDNTVRDVVDVKFAGLQTIEKFGPSRFDPILPGLSQSWKISLNENFSEVNIENLEILWSIYADNAPPEKGKVLVSEIEIVDER